METHLSQDLTEHQPVLIELLALSQDISQATHLASALARIADFVAKSLHLTCQITGPEGIAAFASPLSLSAPDSSAQHLIPLVEQGEELGVLMCQIPATRALSQQELLLLSLLATIAALKLRGFLPPPPLLSPKQLLEKLQLADVYPISSDSPLVRIARTFGIDLVSGSFIALQVEPQEEDDPQTMHRAIERLREELFASYPGSLLVASPEDLPGLEGLIRLPSTTSESALLHWLRRYVQTTPGPQLAIGVGGMIGERITERPTSFQESFEQAREVLTLKHELNLLASVVSNRDIETMKYYRTLPRSSGKQITLRIPKEDYQRIEPYAVKRSLSSRVCEKALELSSAELIERKRQSGRRDLGEQARVQTVAIQVTSEVEQRAKELEVDLRVLLRTAIHYLGKAVGTFKQ